MAKAKRRGSRPGGPGGQSNRGSTTVTKPAPATPGGPNRQVRKEEARRERERLQRKVTRRRLFRWVAIGAAVVILAAGITGFVIYQNGSLARALSAAGCSPVRTTTLYKNDATLDRAHIGAQGSSVTTPPALLTYPTTPPASGPHEPTPQNAGVYSNPPPIYNSIHSLEHAAVEIWYRPAAASSPDVQKIIDFYRNASTSQKDHVIVAPYNYPDQGAAGQLPAGKQMVLVAWHRVQTCTSANLTVVKDFVQHYRVPTGQTPTSAYKGSAPEAGLAI